MRTANPIHKRAVEALVVDKPSKMSTTKHSVKSKKSVLDLDKVSANLLTSNSKQNLAFYRYFFIVTFSLLIFSLLWNTYLYAHADALKSKVSNLSETVDSLAGTVEKFNMYGPYGYTNIGNLLNPNDNNGESEETFIKQVDKEFNYSTRATLAEASEIATAGNLPLIISTFNFPNKVSLQKLYISGDDSETPANEELFYGYYTYSFVYKTYPVTINSGFYPTGGSCQDRDETYNSNYGELKICNKVSRLTFPELTDRYDLPMDYRFEIIDAKMEMPKSYFGEIIDSLKVFEPKSSEK